MCRGATVGRERCFLNEGEGARHSISVRLCRVDNDGLGWQQGVC